MCGFCGTRDHDQCVNGKPRWYVDNKNKVVMLEEKHECNCKCNKKVKKK